MLPVKQKWKRPIFQCWKINFRVVRIVVLYRRHQRKQNLAGKIVELKSVNKEKETNDIEMFIQGVAL